MTDITALASPPGTDAASRLNNSRARLATNYETFLALLTTQLRNQDPLSPLDSNQFTQQIVQMTGVEQQLLTNQLLQTMVDRSSGGVSDAVSYIGREVTADTGAGRLANGSANWTYSLPAAASSATLEVRNESGVVVWRGQAPSRAAGDHAFAWDGRDLSGNRLADGAYSLSVSAQNAAGQAMTARTTVSGTVTGVEQRDGATILVTTAGNVPITAVRRVTQPSVS